MNINYTNRKDKRYSSQKSTDLHRINRNIYAKEVRLIGEGVEPGVYKIEEALKIAKERGVDLVEISSKTSPPVCKVIDYSKFKYEKKKKEKIIRSKSQKVVIKEIRFGPNTDDHDFEFKVRHAVKFLKDGAKIRAILRFKSNRELLFKERGELMLLKFAEALQEHGKVEQMPKLEGKRMSLLVTSKVKKY